MSAHNGDKSRHGRLRKAKINRRIQLRALRAASGDKPDKPAKSTK